MPPMPMTGNFNLGRRLVHHINRDGPDSQPGQPAGKITETALAFLDINGHGREGIDQTHRVGAAFLGRFGNFGYIRHIGR